MQYVFPYYYKRFRCIADRCRHNCCIGWEIDIDPDTLDYYRTVPGDMGQRLQDNISLEGDPHFILGKDERCPFLNSSNLCDIIIELGEEHLCGICTDHPRFRNELPGRIETGLGLCCEAAGALILGQNEPMTLDVSGESECDDEIITFRDKVIALLHDRGKTADRRMEDILSMCGITLPETIITDTAHELLELERLDEEWTRVLEHYLSGSKDIDHIGFARHMADRQVEYEQLAVYLIYRHMANSCDMASAAIKAVFTAMICNLLYCIGADIWTQSGGFTFEQQVELARLFSSEIEYSDENLYILLDWIETVIL